MSDPTLVAAQKLRAYEEAHPFQAIAGGFTPGIGQASAAAALRDPKAPWWEKALSVPGLVPGVGGAAKAIVIGARIAKGSDALEASLKTAKKLALKYKKAAETDDPSKGARGVQELIEGDPRINDEIFKETGWWKDPDNGEWKMELDDSKAYPDYQYMDQMLTNYPKEAGILQMGSIDEIMNHPELAKLPEGRKLLSEVQVEHNFPKVGKGGEYSPLEDTIRFGEDVEPDAGKMRRIREVLLHEKQHAIQEREGFKGRGTNLEAAGSHEAYVKDLGEIEARLVQQRRNMTPEARRKLPFHRHLEIERTRLMDPNEVGRYANQQDLERALKLRNLDPRDMLTREIELGE
jgi:hypothetical protein